MHFARLDLANANKLKAHCGLTSRKAVLSLVIFSPLLLQNAPAESRPDSEDVEYWTLNTNKMA